MVGTVQADRHQNTVHVVPEAGQKIARSVQDLNTVADAWHSLATTDLDSVTLEKDRIVGHLSGGEAHHFDMMRTRVLQQMRQNGWRRLAITSPTAGCGKSTVAVNLALSLRRQAEVRTVLLDCDLRRPSLARMLGIDGGMNLGACLRGDQEFAATARRIGPNLALAANREPALDAGEVFGGRYLPLALAAVDETFAPDVMIFDTPPMLLTHDLMSFAGHVDCVLLVAGAEMTTVKEIDLCERELATQTNVMGVVLNKCQHIGDGYGYDAYE
ncbi:CpsD/CapB family tyrosine-protein kinase [Sulfitobacter sp.]|uniref:CpsD/CapB family tyrosine-protein kinase n=1 Tax=Sulfitobacter sp. TaxID=1903071 RepID=UPI0035663BAD|tara:strand:+ start:1644 stop:2456 length:813 start_codon:yes stop_codon:yes gene_type:complete